MRAKRLSKKKQAEELKVPEAPESVFQHTPSPAEYASFCTLAESDVTSLALTSCMFQGKERFAVVRVIQNKKQTKVQPLALLLHEADFVELQFQEKDKKYIVPPAHLVNTIN